MPQLEALRRVAILLVFFLWLHESGQSTLSNGFLSFSDGFLPGHGREDV
jgi:hypothetical protein